MIVFGIGLKRVLQEGRFLCPSKISCFYGGGGDSTVNLPLFAAEQNCRLFLFSTLGKCDERSFLFFAWAGIELPHLFQSMSQSYCGKKQKYFCKQRTKKNTCRCFRPPFPKKPKATENFDRK